MINEKEKKYIYIVFIIAIIILIISLVIIWSPMFSSNSFSDNIHIFTEHNTDEYIQKMEESYKSVVMKYINIDNYEELKNKLNEKYLQDNNLNIDTAKDFLYDEGILSHPSNSTVIYLSNSNNDGDTYIYSYVYKIGDSEKKIHIIEDYYGKYTISFEQNEYPVLNSYKKEIEKDGLKYSINYNKSYEESILIDFYVENNTTEEYTFNITSLNDASILLNNSEVCYLDSTVVSNQESAIKLTPNSKINFKLSFRVPLEEQGNVERIIFSNVTKSNGDNMIIELNII